MDPEWLLERFGGAMFWVSLAIIFVECGLLFPILPGDSLLFAIGLFINRSDRRAGHRRQDRGWPACCCARRRSSATWSATRSAGRSGRRCTSAGAGS